MRHEAEVRFLLATYADTERLRTKAARVERRLAIGLGTAMMVIAGWDLVVGLGFR